MKQPLVAGFAFTLTLSKNFSTLENMFPKKPAIASAILCFLPRGNFWTIQKLLKILKKKHFQI
jgi:hypothetical protein